MIKGRGAAMWLPGLVLLTVLSSVSDARAFCGFFVGSSDGPLVNPATTVVLMRAGTRTVLSMRNDYQGPPEAFAIVIPVPVVLEASQVRTIPRDVLRRIDVLSAPRLVEYWEQDPCPEYGDDQREGGTGTRAKGEEGAMGNPNAGRGREPAVKVEAQFDVDEYEIVILSATDSSALETWIAGHGYRIPAGAADTLRPYVAAGSKFFVARVDPRKVRFEGDHAVLSPLRFHYDSDAFTLPIRLGLLSAGTSQDLVVNILAPDQRYEAANYENVFIPTNVDVTDATRGRFDEMYAALFDATMAGKPHAVATEYAWSADSCDPCPGPTLTPEDTDLLGARVSPKGASARGWVLTRLHMRYSRETLGDDLVFRPAPPVQGGREDRGRSEQSKDALPAPGGTNAFQARYVIRHAWKGPVRCSDPQRGEWGGPPANLHRVGLASSQDSALAPRGKLGLASFVRGDVPALGLRAGSKGLLQRLSSFDLGLLLGVTLGFLATLVAFGRRRRAPDLTEPRPEASP